MAKRLTRPAVLQRFGRLRVLIPQGRKTNSKGNAIHGFAALCVCDCGTLTAVRWTALYRNSTQSCGCLHRDTVVATFTTHGHTGSAEYECWNHIKKRCLDPNAVGYQNYGGRGITVCARWRDSFTAFLEDMGPRPSPGHSIDRIDNEGNYEPSNCRWATRREQSRNRRTNVWVTYQGKSMVLADAARASGLSQSLLWRRLKQGLEGDALFKPAISHRPSRTPTLVWEGVEMTVMEAVAKSGRPYTTIYTIARRQERTKHGE
jgi:hypothetical protein